MDFWKKPKQWQAGPSDFIANLNLARLVPWNCFPRISLPGAASPESREWGRHRYSRNTCWGPDTVLGSGDTAERETGSVSVFLQMALWRNS